MPSVLLVGVAEIAGITDLSRQRVDVLSKEDEFPEPAADRLIAGGRVWFQADVIRWAKSQGRAVTVKRRPCPGEHGDVGCVLVRGHDNDHWHPNVGCWRK